MDLRTIEIILVAAAFLALLAAFVILGRNAVRFGRSLKSSMRATEPKVNFLIDEADAAQKRSLSIVDTRELLMMKVAALSREIARMRVLLASIAEAWRPVSRVLSYLGL